MKIPVFCGKDCGGDACPLLAEVENGRVVRVVNNPAGGKYLKGCVRGFGLEEELNLPGRLLSPLIRTGERGSGQFREASWEEALGLAAQRLGEVRARYGAESVLNLAGAGATGALHGTPALLVRFLSLFGGCTRLRGSYSNGAASFVLPYLLGPAATRRAGFDPATMQSAEMIILWGANILDTRLGTEVPARLVEARKRGAQVVVLDPRRSATVRHTATWWIPLRPGSDAALMLAVLFVLLDEGLAERKFIAAHSVGFDQLERYVLGLDGGEPRSPAWAEPLTGVPAGEIERFARAYAAAKPAMLLPGYSIQRVYAGEETYRLAVALQLATANFGTRGGSTGALNNRLPIPRVGSLPVPPRPGQPELPILRWPDAVLEGRAGGYPSDIHAIYVLGANPVNQGGDIRKSMAAFARVDFAVCHEQVLTPTARWCDVVFPSAVSLEKEDIGTPWLGNYLLYKRQAVAPPPGVRSDYEILSALAQRLGFGAEFTQGRSPAQWLDHFMVQSEISDPAEFRRSGIYFAPEQERVGLADFAADPRGHPLDTPSGLVEITSAAYAHDTGQPATPAWQRPPDDPRYPLRLISPKAANRTHSQGGGPGAPRGEAEHVLYLNPRDAAARGISDGARVRVFNDQGAIRITARLTVDLAPGAASLHEGVWARFGPDGVDQAGAPNLLTATTGTLGSQAAIMHAIEVEVILD